MFLQPKLMKKTSIITIFGVLSICFSFNFKSSNDYKNLYLTAVNNFNNRQSLLLNQISNTNFSSEAELATLKQQIKFSRSQLKSIENLEGRIEHDIWYLENWSMWLDIKIICMTAFNTLRGDEQAF